MGYQAVWKGAEKGVATHSRPLIGRQNRHFCATDENKQTQEYVVLRQLVFTFLTALVYTCTCTIIQLGIFYKVYKYGICKLYFKGCYDVTIFT